MRWQVVNPLILYLNINVKCWSVNEMLPLSKVMDNLLHQRTHIMLVVDEYGGVRGYPYA